MHKQSDLPTLMHGVSIADRSPKITLHEYLLFGLPCHVSQLQSILHHEHLTPSQTQQLGGCTSSLAAPRSLQRDAAQPGSSLFLPTSDTRRTLHKCKSTLPAHTSCSAGLASAGRGGNKAELPESGMTAAFLFLAAGLLPTWVPGCEEGALLELSPGEGMTARSANTHQRTSCRKP